MKTCDLDKPLIELVGISKDYVIGDNVVHALSNVNLSIMKGELVAIMGPSGSGKTTIMNLLGCLDTPTRGQYFLDGVNISDLTTDDLAATRSTKLGFVFQSFNLLARTTALANVQLPLLYSRVDKVQRRVKAEQTLTDVGLFDRMDHHPSQLSGGEQQRVALARAFIGEPAILFADEPTGNLDGESSAMVEEMLFELNKAKETTLVIVTHDRELADKAGMVLVMKDGRIAETIRA